MGNCLVIQQKELIKLMMADGKILQFPSPLKVHQALSEFPGHVISDELPVCRHLDPETDMLTGQLYYLLQPKKTSATEHGQRRPDVVRIKLVVRKQELKQMVSKGGVSLDELLSQIVHGKNSSSRSSSGGGEGESCRGWKPVLESIPEGNDSH